MNAEISITDHITAAINVANTVQALRKQRAAEAAAEAEAERKRKLTAEWEPHMETLRTALPEWALPYVVTPEHDYMRYIGFDEGNGYAPISIVIPQLAPIAAYVYQGSVYFAVAKPQHDEEGVPCLAQLVYLRNKYEIQDGETDFAIAILKAKDAWDRYTLMLEKYEANCHERVPEPEPTNEPLRARLSATDPAAYLVNILDSMPDMTVPETAPLWSALMLGMELRGIRSALEDIAAALTEPIVEN